MMRWMFAVISFLCLASVGLRAAPDVAADAAAHAAQPGFEPAAAATVARPVVEDREELEGKRAKKFEDYLSACMATRPSPKPESFLGPSTR